MGCSCVQEAANSLNTSLSSFWIKEDYLQGTELSEDQIEETRRRLEADGVEITEAASGWCKVEGCADKFKYFMIAMFLLSILASTGRVGNLLVALRCVELKDKALSMAFQVVFMSLLAMLPSPIIYGAIIDQSCILWQEECGETTNCLLYDTDTLRIVLMLTTAGIASLGVLCDVVVWYYAKDLQIFYNESKPSALSKIKERNGLAFHASNVSLTKDSVYK